MLYNKSQKILHRNTISMLAGLKVSSISVISIIIIIIVVIIIIIIIIIIKLTQSKTTLENTVEIESQPVALDFKNLSQYSSRSKKNCLLNFCCSCCNTNLCCNLFPNCLGITPKEPTTNGMAFTLTFYIFPSLDIFQSYCSPSPQSYYLEELQNQLFYNFSPSYQLQRNLVYQLL